MKRTCLFGLVLLVLVSAISAKVTSGFGKWYSKETLLDFVKIKIARPTIPFTKTKFEKVFTVEKGFLITSVQAADLTNTDHVLMYLKTPLNRQSLTIVFETTKWAPVEYEVEIYGMTIENFEEERRNKE